MAYPWQKGYMSPNKEGDSRKQHCLSQLGLGGNEEQTPRFEKGKGRKERCLRFPHPPPLSHTHTYTHSNLKKKSFISLKFTQTHLGV